MKLRFNFLKQRKNFLSLCFNFVELDFNFLKQRKNFLSLCFNFVELDSNFLKQRDRKLKQSFRILFLCFAELKYNSITTVIKSIL